MSDNNAPSVVAVMAGRNTGIKYEAETKSFWHQMCVKFEEGRATKYNNRMATFLDHPDSGSGVCNINKHRKKMSRYYREFKTGRLTADMGCQRKRHRPLEHLDVEMALIRELQCRKTFQLESMPKKEMRQIALQIAEKLGKKDTFKASHCWLNNVLKRMKSQLPLESTTCSSNLDEDDQLSNEGSERENHMMACASAEETCPPPSGNRADPMEHLTMPLLTQDSIDSIGIAQFDLSGVAPPNALDNAIFNPSSEEGSQAVVQDTHLSIEHDALHGIWFNPDDEMGSIGVSVELNHHVFEWNHSDDSNEAPFEDEPVAASQNADVTTTADRGKVVAPGVKHGTVDSNVESCRRGRMGGDTLAIAFAVGDNAGFDHIMGLPIGVEYDPNDRPIIFKNVRFRIYAIAIVLLFMILIIATTLGVVVFGPSVSIRERLAQEVGPIANVEGTPQDRAARWLDEEDPLQLPADSPFLVQRYLVVLFYFSTTNNGKNPWRSCNPPTWDTDQTKCSFFRLVGSFGSPGSVIGHDGRSLKVGVTPSLSIKYWYSFAYDSTYEYVPRPSTCWLSGTHECEWAGILCDGMKVTRALQLIGQKLTGTLPTELSSFDALEAIYLGYNAFTGTLPTEYAGMSHLLSLEVYGNNLSGTIPDKYFDITSLQNLNIGDNMFSGTLSTKIGQLTNLKGFHNYRNMFTGTFPTEIANLRFLSFSLQHENIYEGSIPTVLGELTLLQQLWMNGNQFTGTLPSEIGRMRDMMDLRFQQNKLTGTIPEEYFDLIFLYQFDVFGNNLTGTLSTRIGQLREMEGFRVSRNRLTGTIPTEIALMTTLQWGWFHFNDFVGSMPTEVCVLRPRPLLFLQADCYPEGNEPNECACCSACCNRETEICQILDNVFLH